MSQLAIVPGQKGPVAGGPKGGAPAAGAGDDAFASALGKARKTADGAEDTKGRANAQTEDAAAETRQGKGRNGEGETGDQIKARARQPSAQPAQAATPGADMAVGKASTADGTEPADAREKTPDGGKAPAAEGKAGKDDNHSATGDPVATVMAVMSLLNAKTVGARDVQGPRAGGVIATGAKAMADGDAPLSVRSSAVSAEEGMGGTTLDGARNKVGAAIEAAFGGAAESRAPQSNPGKGEGVAHQHSAIRLEGQAGIGEKAASLVAPAPMSNDGARPQPIVVPVDLGRALAGEGDLPSSMREAVSSHVARVMAAPAHAHGQQPMSVLRIQLQPAHLGQVNVTMRMSGEQVHVTLTPDSASAARVLGSDQDAIAGVLRSLGGAFSTANVEVAGDSQPRQATDGGAARDASTGQGETFRDESGRQRPGAGAMTNGESAEAGRAGAAGAAASSADGRIII